MTILCSVTVGATQLVRDVVFPFPPARGMIVGWLRVKAVNVCQGDLDGRGSIDVELAVPPGRRGPRAADIDVLVSQGWAVVS